jgi:hypothetical protein
MDAAHETMLRLLSAHPEIDALFCYNDVLRPNLFIRQNGCTQEKLTRKYATHQTSQQR